MCVRVDVGPPGVAPWEKGVFGRSGPGRCDVYESTASRQPVIKTCHLRKGSAAKASRQHCLPFPAPVPFPAAGRRGFLSARWGLPRGRMFRRPSLERSSWTRALRRCPSFERRGESASAAAYESGAVAARLANTRAGSIHVGVHHPMHFGNLLGWLDGAHSNKWWCAGVRLQRRIHARIRDPFTVGSLDRFCAWSPLLLAFPAARDLSIDRVSHGVHKRESLLGSRHLCMARQGSIWVDSFWLAGVVLGAIEAPSTRYAVHYSDLAQLLTPTARNDTFYPRGCTLSCTPPTIQEPTPFQPSSRPRPPYIAS